MIIKVGERYTAHLIVEDENGDRITNDSPVAILNNKDTGQYFNGLNWCSDVVEVIIPHVINGMYSFAFTPETEGTYEVQLKSHNYKASRTETLDVYKNEEIKFQWGTNTEFRIDYVAKDKRCLPVVEIERMVDKTYLSSRPPLTGAEKEQELQQAKQKAERKKFEEEAKQIIQAVSLDVKIQESKTKEQISNIQQKYEYWVPEKTQIKLLHVCDDLFFFYFLPTIESTYRVTIKEDSGYELTYIIDVKDDVDSNASPVIVNNKTLVSYDGTDTTVVNSSGTPIAGAKVKAFDVSTKKLECETQTNQLGEWSMCIKPGKYFFSFEKDNYVSISFERSVN